MAETRRLTVFATVEFAFPKQIQCCFPNRRCRSKLYPGKHLVQITQGAAPLHYCDSTGGRLRKAGIIKGHLMRFISWTIAAVTLACSSGVALAETAPSPEDFSFAMGQMAGSETACDIPKDQVNAMISKALDKMKIEIKEGTPLFDKFTAGFADGTKSVKDGAASCPDVKAGFDTFSAQISQ